MSQQQFEPTDADLASGAYQPYQPPTTGPMAPAASAPTPQTRETRSGELDKTAGQHQFVLAIISLVMGIPITAIASEAAGVPGVLFAWLGIVAVNVFHSLARRRRD